MSSSNDFILYFDGREVELADDENVVGQGSDCDIVLDHPSVSEKHANFVTEEDGLILYDLTNDGRTLVNGVAFNSRQVEIGDSIEIGETVLQLTRETGGAQRYFLLNNGERVAILGEGRFTIGRHKTCPILIDEAQASREHAAIDIDSQGIRVIDLGSTNGTFINGEALMRKKLEPGDRIRLGEVELELRTKQGSPPPAALSAPEEFVSPPVGKTLLLDKSEIESTAPRFVIERAGNPLELDPGEHLVGRLPDCAILIEDVGVSRRHAMIVVQEDGALLRDLKSSNGTFVNDEKVQGERPLEHGNRIKIGETVLLFKVIATEDLFGPTMILSQLGPQDLEKQLGGSSSTTSLPAAAKEERVEAREEQQPGDIPDPSAALPPALIEIPLNELPSSLPTQGAGAAPSDSARKSHRGLRPPVSTPQDANPPQPFFPRSAMVMSVVAVIFLMVAAFLFQSYTNARARRSTLETQLTETQARIEDLESQTTSDQSTFEGLGNSELAMLEPGKMKICNRSSGHIKLTYIGVSYVTGQQLETWESHTYGWDLWPEGIKAGGSKSFDWVSGDKLIWDGSVLFYTALIEYKRQEMLLSGPWADVKTGCLQLALDD